LKFKLSTTSQVLIGSVILIEGAPAGSNVSVDGKAAGTTNSDGELSISVPPGTHEIALVRTGYLSRRFEMRLSNGNNFVDGTLELDPEPALADAALRSTEPAKLEEFLNRYPNNKLASQIRAKIEDLEWNKYRAFNDPIQLQTFIEKYPNGQHIGDARELSAKLQQEDLEWRAAQTSNTAEALQIFVDKYPQTRHAVDARRSITLFNDQAQILHLLKDYQDAFNRQDLSLLLQLWPRCPAEVQTVLSNQFKSKKSGLLKLSPDGVPAIRGDSAALNVAKTRQTESSTTSGTVPFSFRKQNDHWVIEIGSF
jgi:hypothetical protein